MLHDPFHEGERRVQERAGERQFALRVGRGVGDAIPPGAVPFPAAQRLLAIGSVDAAGAVWASVLVGNPGFVSAATDREMTVDRGQVGAIGDDPLWANLAVGAEVGLLAIDLASRRRLRVNGVVESLSARRIAVAVREAYANCPKYIQRRDASRQPASQTLDPRPTVSGRELDAVRKRLIERTDTFFVASRHPRRGVDVSHRGGDPGFVRILAPNRLRVPDYRGNSMFNTLGNFEVDSRAGLAFADFEHGRLLQVVGRAVVHLGEAEDPRQPTGGTGRYWDVDVERWIELPMMPLLEWNLLERSPHNPTAAAQG